jgi:polyribonucleotide nucleotidyltransferase
MKPSPETFKRFLSKELNAFSIGGVGEREVVKAKPAGDGADAEPDADPDDMPF